MTEKTEPSAADALRQTFVDLMRDLIEALDGWESTATHLHYASEGHRGEYNTCPACAADRAAIARLRGEP